MSLWLVRAGRHGDPETFALENNQVRTRQFCAKVVRQLKVEKTGGVEPMGAMHRDDFPQEPGWMASRRERLERRPSLSQGTGSNGWTRAGGNRFRAHRDGPLVDAYTVR